LSTRLPTRPVHAQCRRHTGRRRHVRDRAVSCLQMSAPKICIRTSGMRERKHRCRSLRCAWEFVVTLRVSSGAFNGCDGLGGCRMHGCLHLGCVPKCSDEGGTHLVGPPLRTLLLSSACSPHLPFGMFDASPPQTTDLLRVRSAVDTCSAGVCRD
jgi:hypothetical protein